MHPFDFFWRTSCIKTAHPPNSHLKNTMAGGRYLLCECQQFALRSKSSWHKFTVNIKV